MTQARGPASQPASAPSAAPKISGMGAIPHDQGVAFRVWAPHANQVTVIGSFNDWNEKSHPLDSEENGYWYGNFSDVATGDEYLYAITNGDRLLKRIDPYARQVTNSIGNGVVADLSFDWEGDDFHIAPLNELIVYELHVGTFGRPEPNEGHANLDEAIERLDYLQQLGVNCVELMPVTEFAGDVSWGYNPAHIFAVESAYGGPLALKRFIREAHRRGIGVLLDVVYNHLGPSDLSLWQFDGWSENGMGGIYFYNDWRAETPWGQTRPDYGRGEVRQYLHDNAMYWINEFRADGLRYDMTLYMRSVKGTDLPEGWSLAQWINCTIRKEHPDKILVAEDLQNNEWLTKRAESGGTCFHTQWDAKFVHPIRDVLTTPRDEDRSLETVCQALQGNFNGDPFQRVVYTESHDEVANGSARIPSEVQPSNPQDWFAIKRSTLGTLLVLTTPGVPMFFQGQEFLEDEWFRDTVPVDWDRARQFKGIVGLHRDAMALRRNLTGQTRGLMSSSVEVLFRDDQQKVLAYHRWYDRGPGDDVMVIFNFFRDPRTVTIRFPASGTWKLMLNSDAQVYNSRFGGSPAGDLQVPSDSQQVSVPIGPYSVLIYSWSGPNR